MQYTCIIVMGVSGCGKSTIGSALADALGWSFFDGDAFHSEENIALMKEGNPLGDAEREDWLFSLRCHIDMLREKKTKAVIACSALKKKYRQMLMAHDAMCFVYLHIEKEQALKRMQARRGHFMPPALVQSQFGALEVPTEDEGIASIRVDGESSPEDIVNIITQRLGQGG